MYFWLHDHVHRLWFSLIIRKPIFKPALSPHRKLHQQFEMYKEQVKKMGEESQQQQEQRGDAPTCGICHKTKFADGCGHNCSYCQTKFCARCGGRVSLRSNKVRLEKWSFSHSSACCEWNGADTWNYLAKTFLPNVRGNLKLTVLVRILGSLPFMHSQDTWRLIICPLLWGARTLWPERLRLVFIATGFYCSQNLI